MNTKIIKSLVVGLDLSDYSQIIAREAIELSNKLKINLIFVYCVSPICSGDKKIQIPDFKELDSLIRLKYNFDNSQKIKIEAGCIATGILNVAKAEKEPWILVGHKNDQLKNKYYLGSVVEELLKSSPFPLWIHRGNKIRIPQRILIPSSLGKKYTCTISDVNFLKEVFNSHIEIYFVLSEVSSIKSGQNWIDRENEIRYFNDKKVKKFKSLYPHLKLVCARGLINESVKSYSQSFDLVAISVKKENKISFINVDEKIIRSGDTPVLIFPDFI